MDGVYESDSAISEELRQRLIKETRLDINLCDNEGKSAIQLALELVNDEVVKWLDFKKARISPEDREMAVCRQSNWKRLVRACRNDDVDAVRALIAHGVDINHRHYTRRRIDGTTALNIARDCGHDRIVKILIENGAT